MKELYIYLISIGDYSSYSVDSLLLSEKRISKEELDKLKNEAIAEFEKVRYTEKQFDFHLREFLISKGYKIVYPAGEFHRGDFNPEYNFWDSVREGEENAFRIGLG
jgi:hypothetical protein